MQYSSLIQNLFKEFLGITLPPKKEDKIWNDWLGFKEREPRDLLELLKSDVRDEFKARALVILLAPKLNLLPFAWKESTSKNYLSLTFFEKIRSAPSALTPFIARVLCCNIDYCLKVEGEVEKECLDRYNFFIPKLLSMLPEESDEAGEVFNRFQINEYVPYWNMDTSSGYHPLRVLFGTKEVPDKWKHLADQQMRSQVVAEIEGKKHPREEWEKAINYYIDHIETMCYGTTMYSIDLFASQIDFIVGLNQTEKFFSGYNVSTILQLLQRDQFRDCRQRFVQKLIFGTYKEHYRFTVYDGSTKKAAEMILKEFGDSDVLIKTTLDSLIEQYDTREAQRFVDEKNKENKATLLLNQMK